MTYDHRMDQGGNLLTLFIYMDGITGVLTHGRNLLSVHSLSLGSIHCQEEEIQSTLGRFYEGISWNVESVKKVRLMFINSIFHRTQSGVLETFKNRLPAFLLYHKTYFDAEVTHSHLAQKIHHDLTTGFAQNAKPVLWFHLRHHILFASFCTGAGDISVTSFKVQKSLDVYYYILFNYQTLNTTLPELDQVMISGELLDMDKIHNFFEENLPTLRLVTYWQWKGIPGKPQVELNRWLVEVGGLDG